MSGARRTAGRPARFCAAAAGSLALVATLGATAAPHARPAAVTSYGGELNGVAAISAADAWAVGMGSSTVLYALHWDGSTWTKVPVPHPGTLVNTLYGVSAVSASDVWAVGAYYDNHVGKTLAVRWNGTRWILVPTPSPGANSMYGSNLTDVSAASATDAWAVGYYSLSRPSAPFRSLLLHWNGTRWTRVTNPAPPATTSLGSVLDLSPKDAWITAGSRTRAFMLHWNGTRWTRVAIATPSGASYPPTLLGLSATSPTDIWAVGVYTTPAGPHTLAEHWNGTSWARVATPALRGAKDTAQLNGVTAVSPTDAWAAGTYGNDNSYGQLKARALILHWNGTRWTRVPTPEPRAPATAGPAVRAIPYPPSSPSAYALNAVAAAGPRAAWAVGFHQATSQADYTLILRWNGTAWTRS